MIIWTKVRPVTRRDDKIAEKGGTPLSREINHARSRARVLETFVLLERLSL